MTLMLERLKARIGAYRRNGVSPRVGVAPAAAVLLYFGYRTYWVEGVGTSPWRIVNKSFLILTVASLVYAATHIRTGNGLHCIRCDYAAKGLKDVPVCPECGLDWTHPAALCRGEPWRMRERWTVCAIIVAIGLVSQFLEKYW